MELIRDWTRVALDAGPFFRFGSTGYLLDLVAYLGGRAAITREVETELIGEIEEFRHAQRASRSRISRSRSIVALRRSRNVLSARFRAMCSVIASRTASETLIPSARATASSSSACSTGSLNVMFLRATIPLLIARHHDTKTR
jgi:hypothetical protein